MSKALHAQLIEGLTVKSRPNGTVHTIKNADGKVVAEVCVGQRKVRLNFRESVKAPKGIELTGKSKNWAGGGVVVDEANVSRVREMLASVAAPAVPKPKRTRSTAKAA